MRPERLCKQGSAVAAAAVCPLHCQTPALGAEVSAAASQLQYQTRCSGKDRVSSSLRAHQGGAGGQGQVLFWGTGTGTVMGMEVQMVGKTGELQEVGLRALSH